MEPILTETAAMPNINLTKVLHHDVYDEINPLGGLGGSCAGMTVMVTGSGRGIGQAIAKAFAQAGASRLVLTARSQNELQSTFDSIRNDQHILVAPAILMFPLDITSDVAVKQMFSDLDAQDWPLEVLVNNAGHMERCLNIHFSDPTEWWKTWEVNVKGTYLTTHNALKAKLVSPRKEPLTIINVSSSAALMVKPGFSAYQCSKSAQTRFTEFIHAEYAHHNVRTFCFQPGGIVTSLSSNMPSGSNSNLQDTPELAAGFAVYLASPENANSLERWQGRYLSALWDVRELERWGADHPAESERWGDGGWGMLRPVW